jgi:hypothetical protein
MGRRRLTLPELVANGRFDAGNHRHRRALDTSGPLSDPELEKKRQIVVSLRLDRVPSKFRAAEALQEFARAVNRR